MPRLEIEARVHRDGPRLVKLEGLETRKPDQPLPADRSSAWRWARFIGAAPRKCCCWTEPLAALDK